MSAIEGIPDGYEFVRIGTPKQGEPYLTPKGRIEICEGGFEGKGYAVLRKIEKPKQYRPFASAAEFEPFSDMWLNRVDNNGNELPGRCKINGYDDEGFWNNGVHLTFAWAFKVGYKFADGDERIPFGIEVTE